jgi:Domain of unknown function (DUF4384)
MTHDVHTPRNVLEELAVGTDVAPAARAHVAACERCQRRLDAISSAAKAYLASYPADAFARQVAARAQRADRAAVAERERPPNIARRRLFGGLGVLAMAAGAIALWVRLPAPTPDAIRLKGGMTWSVFAKRGARAWPVVEGETLKPGDQLAFTYSLSQDRFLWMLGIDDAGTITQYGPEATPVRLARGQGRVPFAIELDARPGEERLFALFSQAPLDVSEAKRVLAVSAARARRENRWVTAADLTLPAEIATFGFKKR